MSDDRDRRLEYIIKTEKIREHSAHQAKNTVKPGPAERMVSYKERYSEKAKAALEQERIKVNKNEKDIAAGRAPTPIDKILSRLPEKPSGPER